MTEITGKKNQKGSNGNNGEVRGSQVFSRRNDGTNQVSKSIAEYTKEKARAMENNGDIHYNRAVEWEKAGNRAENLWEEDLSFLSPKQPLKRHETQANRGKSRTELREAVRYWETALKLDASHETLCKLGCAYVKLGYIEDALKSFHSALEIEPNNVDARFFRSRLLAGLYHYAGAGSAAKNMAVEDLRLGLGISPVWIGKDALRLFRLSETYEWLGESGKAVECLEKINLRRNDMSIQ